MTGVAQGIAHVSFSGGGIFVPARTPYDRQMLIEHVVDRVRAKGQVQVLVDSQRWLVHLLRERSATKCWSCGIAPDSVCYPTAASDVVLCVRCAFTARGIGASLDGSDTVQSQDDAA